LVERPTSSGETLSAKPPHRFIKGETPCGLVNEPAVSIHHDAARWPFLPTAFIFSEWHRAMVNRSFASPRPDRNAGFRP